MGDETLGESVGAAPPRLAMRLSYLNRRVHHWLSLVVLLPLALVAPTGVLLQLKKQLTWVQPPEHRGSGAPALALPALLDTLRTLPAAQVASWDDVERVDVRPAKQLVKVTTANRHEVQLDAATGRVLQVAYRRSDLIEQLHDGSFFGDGARYGLFTASGVALFVMWLTGIVLFVQPYWVKARKRRRATEPSGPRQPTPPPGPARA